MIVEERISKLGIDMPQSSPAGGSYTPIVRSGNMLFVAGQIPQKNGEFIFTGKVGNERSLAFAQDAARLCIINMTAALKAYTQDLDRIKQAVKLTVYVNSEIGFLQQHLVGNSASELLVGIFGPAGAHARTALGVNQLPMDVTVEVEGIFEIVD